MLGGQASLVVYVSLLAELATTAGIFVLMRFKDWGRENSTYFACFAAGAQVL